ncbi:unnamed protein product [Spirodela intermedia]|uniref:Uncharacterized protein n=1 Tax=Spirodela intermedia TaxID=51605 RepID=A0A7I8I976_SPIIN|nr:unnamed protein product [Spirodela intermedia]CAA6653471.1 unnamed protein product [Spirodela intermedia]
MEKLGGATMREESKRRFREALSRIYFPARPPPLSPSPAPAPAPPVGVDHSDLREGRGRGLSSESGEQPRRLTRSQRKRLRKRKLKEAAPAAASGRRRKIIGPLLPSSGSTPASERLEGEEGSSEPALPRENDISLDFRQTPPVL